MYPGSYSTRQTPAPGPPSAHQHHQRHTPAPSVAPPPSTTSNSNAHWDGVYVSCNQCLQPIASCRNVLTPCLHVFCYPCAQEQFAMAPCCPVCKAQFDPSKDVRCISTTDHDVREYGRRLCTFAPRQLVDVFSYSLKFWSWQQVLSQKLKTQADRNREQHMHHIKHQQSELEQTNAQLVSQNQSLSASNAGMKQYIQQLEQQLKQAGSGGGMGGTGSGAAVSHHHGPPSSSLTSRQYEHHHTPHQYQPPPPQHHQSHMTPAPGYHQTPGYRGTTAPFTPFAHSTRHLNQQPQHTPHHHHHPHSTTHLPTATPAVFGMASYKPHETPFSHQHRRSASAGAESGVIAATHTSYSNGAITPIASATSTAMNRADQGIPSITSGSVLGDRARIAAARRASQGQ